MRTWQGQPVPQSVFGEILAGVEKCIELKPQHEVLDLCGGNGLISMHLAPRCRSVVCVDVATELLSRIDTAKHTNISPVAADALACRFREESFDRIIIYAAVQYFDNADVVRLLGLVRSWLRPDGIVFLGDVPDADRMWRFFNTAEREARYFQGVASGQPVIGTWFTFTWLEKLARHCGFRSAKRIDQPGHWPYAHFRFDAVLVVADG